MKTPEQIVLLSEEAANQQFGVKPSVPKVHYRIGYQVGYEAGFKTPWVDVYDHLPELGITVLVDTGKRVLLAERTHRRFIDNNGSDINDAQYWMLIPETPKS